MTDEELDGSLVLILFYVKKEKNPCPPQNLKDFG